LGRVFVFYIVGWQGGRVIMQFIPHSIWSALLFPISCWQTRSSRKLIGMGDLKHVSNQVFSRG
jgi:hypothetical protein